MNFKFDAAFYSNLRYFVFKFLFLPAWLSDCPVEDYIVFSLAFFFDLVKYVLVFLQDETVRLNVNHRLDVVFQKIKVKPHVPQSLLYLHTVLPDASGMGLGSCLASMEMDGI